MCWGGEGSCGQCGPLISNPGGWNWREGEGGLKEEHVERDFCSLSGELPRFPSQKNK